MSRKIIYSLLAILSLCLSAFASAEAKHPVGVVNFSTCMTDSKLGKQEQSSFESLKTQLTSLLEDTEKKLNELTTKFNDEEYMAGLSPDAEETMKNKFRSLNEEMNRYQNQYYQVLQQANMKMVQTVGSGIQEAAEKVAKDKKLNVVMSKEACFFAAPALDITSQIITEMDFVFDQKKAAQSTQASNANVNDNSPTTVNASNNKSKK